MIAAAFRRRLTIRGTGMRGPGPYSGPRRKVFTLGVGGPVGSGKTALVERLCREFWPAIQSGRHHERYLHP